ncbi:alpha/beta hydrolase [Novosphingobium sp.]|uniref:alpha/beta fold hydrolase n=1 Tax=Novosphingobium sp. TaxID=1874826 RepID=UPI0025F8E17D|nr:alpha/beta hydrolase [Novosphingobium sp.]MCC6924427.1 alpha/beta hydrolase [Novosphingobium sp.]
MKRILTLAAVAALSVQAQAKPSPAVPIVFPDQFDSIGTPVQSMTTKEGRKVHFTDTGEPGWKPLLLIGGVGTSGRAPELVAFLDTMRRRLKVRIIAVERNGLGDTAFDPAWTFADYNSEVAQVMAHLGIDKFALAAISGGGAYAGHVVNAMPQRITSWHMLAAVSSAPGDTDRCKLEEATFAQQLAPQIAAPRVWWDMPKDGVSAHVRGFSDRTADEGARAFFIAGQKGDPRGVAREYKRFCEPPADVAAFKAPAFFYYGEADPAVPPAHGRYWAGKVAGKVTFRSYPGEGHDVQYRHWDQLLLDVAGYGDRTLVCDSGRAHLVAGQVDPNRLAKGRTLGVCAWQQPKR